MLFANFKSRLVFFKIGTPDKLASSNESHVRNVIGVGPNNGEFRFPRFIVLFTGIVSQGRRNPHSEKKKKNGTC